MKKEGLFFVGICMLLTGCISSGKHTAKTSGWKLVWEENFDTKGEVDETVWSKIPRGKSDWNNYMSPFDSCYALRNGNLVLRGIVNHTQQSDTATYLTGGVYTHGKKLFYGGRIEVSAKLQGAQGAWPAIWMLPEGATWPNGGEIDIMERLNHDSIAYQTTHSYYTQVLGEKNNPPHGGTNKINPTEYNTYSVDIYPDSLVYAINHKHTYTYPRIQTDKEGQFPFFQPYYLLIDMQLGGTWVGNVNPKELPVEMYIDWVRYYKRY